MSDHRSRAGVFAACFLVSVGANAYMIAPASIVPLLEAAFEIDKASAGLAISAAVLGSVLIQLPFGYLMDHYDNRRLMTLGTVVFAPVAIAASFAGAYPPLPRNSSRRGRRRRCAVRSRHQRRRTGLQRSSAGFVTTVFIASAPLGFAIGQFGGPIIASAFGWGGRVRRLSAPLCDRVSRLSPLATDGDSVRRSDHARRVRARATEPLGPARLGLRVLFVPPLYLHELVDADLRDGRLPLSLGEAGAITALLPAVGMVARPVGGWLSDYVGYRRRLIVVCSLAFALPAFFVVSRTISTLLFSVIMLGVGFSLQFGMGVYYVYTRELATAGTGGTSLAVFTSIAFTGTLVSPTLGGWLIGAFSWETTFLLYACIGIAGIGVLFLTGDSSPTPIE